MGADLITASIAVPSGHTITDEDIERAIDNALPDDMTFGKLPDTSEIEDVIADWEENHPGVDLDSRDPLPASLREDVRNFLRSSIRSLREVFDDPPRDVNTYGIGDFLLYVVGGTSWGDIPGDSFATLAAFAAADDASGGKLSTALGVLWPELSLNEAIRRGTTKKVHTPADPRTPEEVVRDASETNDLEGYVALNLDEVLEKDVFSVGIREAINDALSAAMTGSPTGLTDIKAIPIGVTEDDLVVYEVSGAVNVKEFEWPAT
jgi:hypothetical protein